MQSATANYTEKASYDKQVDFTIAHRQPSGFSKDGGKTRIDYPKHKRILEEDRCVLTKERVDYFNELWGGDSPYLTINEKGAVSTMNDVVIGSIGSVAHKRYIKGNNSIWKVEQEKLGIKPTKDDGIFLLNGDYSVNSKERPTSKGLLIFLLTHNANADYPFRDKTISAESFKIVDRRRNAVLDLESDYKIQEARDIVYAAYDRRNNIFDKDKMEFYTNVFRKQISGYESNEEKFRALLSIATTNPDAIISVINKENVNYLQTVQQAIGLDILSRQKGKYVNTMTQNTVVTFKVGMTDEAIIEKMVEYYESKEGAAEYEHLKNSVKAVKDSRISNS